MPAERTKAPAPSGSDWTTSPAKVVAVLALAALGVAGLAWSFLRGPVAPTTPPAPHSRVFEIPQPPPGVSLFDSHSGRIIATGVDVLNTEDGDEPEIPQFVGPPSAPPLEPAVEHAQPRTEIPSQQPRSLNTTSDAVPSALTQTININTADEAALQLLPAIGPTRARAIVLDRAANGSFRSLDDLDRVQGIGPSIIAGLRRFARVE